MLLITIDGPAGAGKTTVSKRLANCLSYTYVDTGALYRGIAFEVKLAGVDYNNDVAMENLCSTLNMKFVPGETGDRLLSNDSDITDNIRTPEITMLSSAVSARPVVRKYLLNIQREMGQGKGVVFEGRDMGTVVFPDADIKFFLDASPQTRAFRRYEELAAKTGQTLEAVREDMKRRDQNDSSRATAPLKPAEDAIIIDATDLSADAVVESMLSYIKNK